VFLQSYTNSENILVGPYGETYPTSHDANQAMNVKAEAVSDAEEEEDPLQIAFPEIKSEPEVSCVLLGRKHKCAEVPLVFLIYISVYACVTSPLCC
jgi:hypothetical protein